MPALDPLCEAEIARRQAADRAARAVDERRLQQRTECKRRREAAFKEYQQRTKRFYASLLLEEAEAAAPTPQAAPPQPERATAATRSGARQSAATPARRSSRRPARGLQPRTLDFGEPPLAATPPPAAEQPADAQPAAAEGEEASPPAAKRRRATVKWSPPEVLALTQGVELYCEAGNNQWAFILKKFPTVFHHSRTPADLKDKWRNVLKAREQAQQGGAQPRRKPLEAHQTVWWAQEEEAELRRLVGLHGAGDWKLIKAQGHAVFKGVRSAVDLKDKWRLMRPGGRKGRVRGAAGRDR